MLETKLDVLLTRIKYIIQVSFKLMYCIVLFDALKKSKSIKEMWFS